MLGLEKGFFSFYEKIDSRKNGYFHRKNNTQWDGGGKKDFFLILVRKVSSIAKNFWTKSSAKNSAYPQVAFLGKAWVNFFAEII